MKFIQKEGKVTRYPLKPEWELMPDVPYQKVLKVKKAYEDIKGTYDAIFDEIGCLGEWKVLIENVKYMNMSLELVEEYFGCLPEDVEELMLHDIDPSREKQGLWNYRSRLLQYIPTYLLDRIRYLKACRIKDPVRNIPDVGVDNIRWLYDMCRRYLNKLEVSVCEVSNGDFKTVDEKASVHYRVTPSFVSFDAYKISDDKELDSFTVTMPVEIYDLLRNDDETGFNCQFLSYEFSVANIRDLYEQLEDILRFILKEEA